MPNTIVNKVTGSKFTNARTVSRKGHAIMKDGRVSRALGRLTTCAASSERAKKMTPTTRGDWERMIMIPVKVGTIHGTTEMVEH